MTPDRAPLLLIHGFTDSALTWAPLRPLLEDDFELIVPALPGHRGGEPVEARPGFVIRDMADALERVLDDAGHERVHLVGNSLGGSLAIELALRGRALSVLAISPAQGWTSDAPPRSVERVFRQAHRAGPYGRRLVRQIASRPRARKFALAAFIANGDKLPPAVAAELLLANADCTIAEAYGEDELTGAYRREVAELDIPLRIAWGRRDRTLPYKTCTPRLKEEFPAAEWAELPGCGHLAHHD